MIYRLKKGRKQPVYITDDIWFAWCAHWKSDEVVEKSRKAAMNRLTEPDGPGTGINMHRGRSRCAQHHAASLAQEKGFPSDQVAWEVFQRLHFSTENSSPKSARIAVEVQAKVDEMRQPLPGTTEKCEVDMSALYLEVAGMDPKKRVFGLSGLSRFIDSSARGSSSQSTRTSQFQPAGLQWIVQEQVAEMRDDLRAEYDDKLARSSSSYPP